MSLHQILLVLKREYMTRIRSKAFILATILIPLGMIAFVGIVVGITLWDSDTQRTIAISDQTEVLYPRLEELAAERYRDYPGLAEDSLRALVQSEEVDGYIVLSEQHVTGDANPEFVSSGAGGLKLQTEIRSDIREVVRNERLARANVSEDIRNIYASSVTLETRKLTQEGEETEDDTGFLTILGIIMGVVIFGSITGYGGLITRSVIEEKTNRIVEVIASSVKPIELLFGKMGGIGALALTQMTIWIISIFGFFAAAGPHRQHVHVGTDGKHACRSGRGRAVIGGSPLVPLRHADYRNIPDYLFCYLLSAGVSHLQFAVRSHRLRR